MAAENVGIPTCLLNFVEKFSPVSLYRAHLQTNTHPHNHPPTHTYIQIRTKTVSSHFLRKPANLINPYDMKMSLGDKNPWTSSQHHKIRGIYFIAVKNYSFIDTVDTRHAYS